MIWLFSAALLEAFSGESSSDGERSAQSKLTPSAQPFLHNGKTTDISIFSRFGLTCELLTADRGEDVLTSFLEAFPVRTLAPQDLVQELTENEVACGESLRGSFARWDHVTCSWKTPRCLLPEEFTEFSGAWPQWGLMRDGVCWEQSMPALNIAVSEYGLWPTPSGTRSGKNHVVGRLDEWGGKSNRFRGTSLAKVRCPEFEEWMLGWPESWTAPTPLETAKFQQWLRSHGEC